MSLFDRFLTAVGALGAIALILGITTGATLLQSYIAGLGLSAVGIR